MNGIADKVIKVFVVEDSPVTRELLVYILSSDPKIQVVGTATFGEEAVEAVKRLKPDVITMDIHMPGMDGFEATRKIMETNPTPIVIVTGSSMAKEISIAMHAIEAGALTVLQKPKGIGSSDHEAEAANFVQTIKLMSEVKVVRRWSRSRKGQAPVELKPAADVKLIAIGASTGGPPVLQTILSSLPKNFNIPLLIVQHMAVGFIHGFVEWLGQTCDIHVQVAQHGMPILPGHAYVAPDGFQMEVETDGKISLTKDRAEMGHSPSVSHLFRSIAEVYGKNAVGVLLTGMGADGAKELKLMKDKGALTIAQDKESSVVYGMPGGAIEIGGATQVLPPERIAAALLSLMKSKSENGG